MVVMQKVNKKNRRHEKNEIIKIADHYVPQKDKDGDAIDAEVENKVKTDTGDAIDNKKRKHRGRVAKNESPK